MIKWNIADRRIELTPRLGEKGVLLVSFQPDGTVDTQQDCLNRFMCFIVTFGVLDQWENGGLREFFVRLWFAAAALWGYPVWSDNLTSSE